MPTPTIDATGCESIGGCNFALRPSRSARDEVVVWSAGTDTATIVLTALPACLPDDGNLAPRLTTTTLPADVYGTHLLQPIGDRSLHLIRLPGVDTSAALAALVPLDPSGSERLGPLDQLLRALLGQRVRPDPRLTRQQRRRLRHMLQACDGRESGANYRQIAAVLFGAERVAADPWKSSALRDATMALVRDGRVMIAGGYRTLLRRRRP